MFALRLTITSANRRWHVNTWQPSVVRAEDYRKIIQTHPAIFGHQQSAVFSPSAAATLWRQNELATGITYGLAGDQLRTTRKWMRVSRASCTACGRAKGVCLIVITLMLWDFLKSWRVVRWGEDAVESGMMVEMEGKHVSICCRDVGATKRNFHLGQISPKPKDVVQGWAERRRWTHRNNRKGQRGCLLCLPEYKWKIKQIGAPTKLWHRNQPPNDTCCWVAKGEHFFLSFFFFLSLFQIHI